MTNWGLDCLAGAKYQDLIAREIPQGWNLGAFSSLFGDVRPLVKKLLAKERIARSRIQLLWSDTHTFGVKQIDAAVAEAKKWRVISKDFGARLAVSPWCEHRADRSLVTKLHEAIMNTLPDCVYVNCPIDQGAMLKGVMNEVHGDEAVPVMGNYSFSFDGSSCVDADVTEIKERLSTASMFFWWIPQFNLRRSVKDNTPRHERLVRPTAGLIRSVVYLATERGAVKLPPRWLLKSHAEDTGSSRSNKPCFIVPLKTSRVTLKCDGKVIAKCPYYGPFGDGRSRFYAQSYGYVISQKAREISGRPTVEVWADGRKWGVVNPAFRLGVYR